MASLDCHIRTPDPTAHARLAWRADCPLCAHRLAGPPPTTDIVSQRTRAVAAAAVIVAATLAPTASAVAQEGMGDATAPPGGKGNEQAPAGPDRTQPPLDAVPGPVERDGPSVPPPPDVQVPNVEVPDVEVDPLPAPRPPQREEREVVPPAATPDRERAEPSPSRPERPDPPVSRDEPQAPPRDRGDRDRPDPPRPQSPGDQGDRGAPSPPTPTPPPTAERPVITPADDPPAPRGNSRGESRGQPAPDDDRRRGPAARDSGAPPRSSDEGTKAMPFGVSDAGDQDASDDSAARSADEPQSGGSPGAASAGDRDSDDESSRARSADQDTYTVASGDSLWAIAAQQLGDDATDGQIAQLVTELWDLNHHRIQSGDPDLIYPDLELRLP
jgi:hypothetical protein